MTITTSRLDRGVAADPSELVTLLQQPEAYNEETKSVELIETHISWVFLTDRFAYKLKKPVRFDFLDFSTPELRRKACETEVNLNRRLAPGVYLGVTPVVISRPSGLPMVRELPVESLHRDETPVDWLVKMKRLPSNRALDIMIRDGSVKEIDVSELARVLASFYENLPPVTITVDSYRRGIEQHASANREELAASSHQFDSALIQRLHAAQLRVLKLGAALLNERVLNGRIVEGHGDLRPEHIYYTPSPMIIDCVEFSQEFRTLDVLDELAFLSLECDALGATEIPDVVVGRYREQTGDQPSQLLYDFYRLYRACVRAKVCSLRAEQLGGGEHAKWLASARQYLALADRYSRMLGPPVLLLVRGLPGTGKSTIAQTIRDDLGIELLQTDAIRREMFGQPDKQTDFNEGRYGLENRARVYEAMHRRADDLLREGTSAILDATYLSADLRLEAANVANNNGAQFLAVHCRCPDEIALQRITDRAQHGETSSETRPEFFDQQRQLEEPDPSVGNTLCVDTSSGVAAPVERIYALLRSLLWKEPTAMIAGRPAVVNEG